MSEQSNRANPKPPPVDRLSQLWRRINDYKMVQWSVAYVALAYGLQHGVILTSESLEWPHAIQQISMLVLASGLPVVMTFAWYHGERASRRISGPELTIISLLLVMSSLMFYVFVRPSEPIGATPSVQQAGVAAARAAAVSPKGAVSLAVLPFANLSDDKQQEFFSDGMTDEISGALSKIADLRVVGRASAFQFKGENKDLRAIGQSLGATHLIEGSVRKAGNRVRISAELVRADNGLRVWSENYDRELTDVFAIQEDIAKAIAASLRMPLGLKPGENLVNNRKIDPDSYDKFLRGEALYQSRGGGGNPDTLPDLLVAASLLEQVVAKNPSYAPAWLYLGTTYSGEAGIHAQNPNETLEQSQALITELRDKGEAAEQRALQLDSSLAGAYEILGAFKWSRGKLAEGDELMARSVALDGESAEGLFGYSLRLGAAGRSKEAGVLMEKANALEPLIPLITSQTADLRWVNGDESGAIALAKTVRPLNRALLLALIYAAEGNFSAAAEALNEIAGTPGSPAANAVQLLRRAPARVAPRNLPVLPGNLQFVYAYAGAPERAIAAYQREVDAGFIWGGTWLRVWHPSFAATRKTPQFKTLMQRAGFVDFWRTKGWPPQCHPTTGDDFACE